MSDCGLSGKCLPSPRLSRQRRASRPPGYALRHGRPARGTAAKRDGRSLRTTTRTNKYRRPESKFADKRRMLDRTSLVNALCQSISAQATLRKSELCSAVPPGTLYACSRMSRRSWCFLHIMKFIHVGSLPGRVAIYIKLRSSISRPLPIKSVCVPRT